MIRVIPTVNAGFLISDGDTTFLVDSIFDMNDEWISGPDEVLLSDMLAGRPPFSNLSAVLTTHLHPDHGSPELFRRLADKTIPLVMPDTATRRSDLKALQNPLILIRGTNSGRSSVTEFGNARVVALPSAHDGGAYYQIEHCCFIIDFPCGSIFITGDAATDGELLLQELKGALHPEKKLKAAFMNYPEIGRQRGRDFITDVLKPEIVFLCHLKKPEDDTHGMITMAQNRVARYSAGLSEMILFDGTQREYLI
jgi:L-ascorbate metabolism protein UlaG (beta-lactamase superfamily)